MITTVMGLPSLYKPPGEVTKQEGNAEMKWPRPQGKQPFNHLFHYISPVLREISSVSLDMSCYFAIKERPQVHVQRLLLDVHLHGYRAHGVVPGSRP